MNPDVRLALTESPGIYRMLRSNGDILYVGKSASIRKRVNSYFQKQTRHAEHILEMLTQARKVDITPTESALEAALLESDEIKSLAPPYNVALKEHDRQIGFCSADLKGFSEEPDNSHRFGPIPSFEGFRLIPRLWESDVSREIPNSGVLQLWGNNGPDEGALNDGIAEFKLKYSHFLSNPTMLRLVASLGFELWKERQRKKDQEEEDENSDTPESNEDGSNPTEEGLDWNPERVVSLFESMVLRAAHLLRKARWFVLMSECSLAWESTTTSSAGKNLIVISSGRIVERTQLNWDQQPPPPPGHFKRITDRQRCFDLATYDRLSVLTTELRRLLGSGRRIELRVGERASLSEPGLLKVLEWL
jgi:hypothetical protein